LDDRAQITFKTLLQQRELKNRYEPLIFIVNHEYLINKLFYFRISLIFNFYFFLTTAAGDWYDSHLKKTLYRLLNYLSCVSVDKNFVSKVIQQPKNTLLEIKKCEKHIFMEINLKTHMIRKAHSSVITKISWKLLNVEKFY
jgi:hypothetical protein